LLRIARHLGNAMGITNEFCGVYVVGYTNVCTLGKEVFFLWSAAVTKMGELMDYWW